MKENDKFNITRFINFLNKKTREKNPKKIYTFDVIDAVDYSFEKFWQNKVLKSKYKYPLNFKNLHNFFPKIYKKFKYETIFNVYDPLDNKNKSYYELGILSFNFKKKYFFLVDYYNYLGIDFGIDTKNKLKEFPNREKLMELTHIFLEKNFPKVKGDSFDDYGEPIYGSWGKIANFTSKLELNKSYYELGLNHPLYHYSLLNREKIEKSFLSYPFTKINYKFGKK